MSQKFAKLLSRYPELAALLDNEENEDLRVFKLAVLENADEYNALIAALRAKGVFKSFFPTSPMQSLLSSKDLAKYSLLRAIKSASEAEQKGNAPIPDGFEGEIATTLSKAMAGRHIAGFAVPMECLKTLNATNFTLGGALGISNTLAPFDVLRNACIVAKAGAMIFEDVKGDLVFPQQSTGATGEWLSEVGAMTETDQAEWEALALTRHRVGAIAKLTRELLQLTGGTAEAWARREVLNAVSVAIDQGALSGIGGVQPLGVGYSPYVQKIEFGGAPTLDKVSEMERLVANANAPDDDICFVASPDVRKAWRNTSRGDGLPLPLWNDGNEVLGRPAFATKNAPGNRVICGAFSHLAIAVWGTIDVLVNPYTQVDQGIVRFTVNAFADSGEVYPKSFCASSDDANQ